MKNIVDTEKKLKGLPFENISEDLMKEAKQNGFSDLQIASLTGSAEMSIRNLRKKLNVLPVVKQIDTLAAEFPAQTNYLYLTYNGVENDIEAGEKNQIVVLG